MLPLLNQKDIVTLPDFLSDSAKQTIDFAASFAKRLKVGDIVALAGNLGSGKTTFTKGIAKGDKVVAEFNSKKEKSHSDVLAITVEKLLKKTRLKPKDIDLYAVSIGPGSFTGLRIGVAFIKGMNLFLNKPVVCVPTLDVLAGNVKTEAGLICTIVDAKRKNVYNAIYKNNRRISKYSVIPIADVLKIVGGEHCSPLRHITFTGDGIDVYKNEIVGAYCNTPLHIGFTEKSFWYTKASDVAKIGYRMYNEFENIVKDLKQLKPMYLYPRDVQCKKKGTQNASHNSPNKS